VVGDLLFKVEAEFVVELAFAAGFVEEATEPVHCCALLLGGFQNQGDCVGKLLPAEDFGFELLAAFFC
jgi:hypothetical protein